MAADPQDPKTVKALAALDTMAAVWAAKINARHAVRTMLACPDAEDRLCAFLQHAHAEGLFDGFHAGKAFRRPAGVADATPPDKPTSEQMMAGYTVACRFGVLEARAFNLAEQMWQAMSAHGVALPDGSKA